jgi:uncharacterized repeat protein (TIGR02543 family)
LGGLFTWGFNYEGQLGDGTTTIRFVPTKIQMNYPTLILTNTCDYGSAISEFVPTREGYTFSGWHTDIYMTADYVFGTIPAGDIKLFACWIPIV